MESTRNGAFLRRLAGDTTGNALAIMAAAFFPMAALIGGGVDMGRIYITKTRLQQACDAGALAGRKAMASGAWTTSGTNNTRDQAYRMFTSNFKSGEFGTDNLSREFTEAEGTVTGVASADVPMTLMKIFGEEDREVSVTCTAEMEIPNTDVMFVLDVTGSMAGSNMTGLKSAVKCFYEALVQVNTPEVCGANDPTATEYDGTAQIRLGFVPYSVNVNVGKLLPNEYFADAWNYQSRKPNFDTVYSWTLGTASPIDWDAWSSKPSLNSSSDYQNWQELSVNNSTTVTLNGTTYPRRPKTSNGNNLTEEQCLARNTTGSGWSAILGYTDVPTLEDAEEDTPGAPVHPATTYTLEYEQEEHHRARGYRYRYHSSGDRCRMWRSDYRDFTIEREGSATAPITWNAHQHWNGTWTYNAWEMDVSGFKDGGSTWHSSAGIPGYGVADGDWVKLSGSDTSIRLRVPADLTLSWDGCVEERQTFRNTDGDPSDDWDPIPDEALDMDINLVPSAGDAGTQWGPMLPNAVWGRYNSDGDLITSSRTTSQNLSRNRTYYCSTESRKLTAYDTVGDLVTYIDSFTPVGNTYHDVGLLWGARLLSPTGIFADENAETANGGAIERHLIFMSDGDAQTDYDNLYSFGLPTHDRRQTSYRPSSSQLTRAVEARLAALCTEVRNMNITLWVISYGGALNEENEDRLEACASPGHYYDAADGPALIARFRQIAAEIADLRLTQ